MISFEVNAQTSQLIANVDNVLDAIKSHYQVEHVQKLSNGEHAFSFGRHPIKEHHITFSPFGNQHATLSINNIDTALVQAITGSSVREIGAAEAILRKEKGNQVANAYARTFKTALDAFFQSDAVRMSTNNYMSPKVNLHINIENVTPTVTADINLILQHCSLLPQASQHY